MYGKCSMVLIFAFRPGDQAFLPPRIGFTRSSMTVTGCELSVMAIVFGWLLGVDTTGASVFRGLLRLL
jgi:hypothetical protein